MKMIDGKLYMTFSDLMTLGFSESFLWKATHEARTGKKKSYLNIPDPDDARICLVQYDTIPSQTRQEKGLPEEAELIASQVIPSLITRSHEVLDFFKSPQHPQPVREAAEQYQTTVAYLDWVAPATVSFARRYGFAGVDPLYSAVMRLLLSEKLHVWQITNLDRFKRKISPFKKYAKTNDPADRTEALQSLVSNRFGKKNAAKVKALDKQGEEIRSALIIIYSDPVKFTLHETYLKYMEIAVKQFQLYQSSNKKEGWDQRCFITEQAVADYLLDTEVQQVWYAKRHGEREARNKFERSTKRLPASFANAKWIMDGTPLHRYFMDGTSAYNRVHVYFVMDAYSWAIIGVGVSLIGETAGQVLQALRSASQRVGWEAGDNKLYVPHEVQADNSSANQSFQVKEAVRLIGSAYIPPKVENAKAKKVEPLNKHFFARWMKYRTGFTGSMGMSTELNNKVNQEELTRAIAKKELPDLRQTLIDLQEDVENWNNDRSWNNDGIPQEHWLSPMEKYKASLIEHADRQRTISEHLEVEALYYMPTKAKQVKDESKAKRAMKTIHIPQEYTYSNAGIQIDRKSPFDGKTIRIELDVPDPDFNARYIGSKFTLRIEPLNYDHAYLFQDGKPVLDAAGNWVKAVNKELFHEALADHTEGEAKRLHAHEQIKKDQKAIAVSRYELHTLQAKALGIETGKITNPRLAFQKETTDAIKIEHSERLLNGHRYQIEAEPVPVEPAKTESPKLNRYEL